MKAIESQAASKPQAGVTDAGSGETIIFTNHVAQAVDEAVERMAPTSVFVIADVNTASFVLPRLQSESKAIGGAKVIMTKAGEMFKNIDTLAMIWKQLGDGGATGKSVVINLGGGVVTDMGAFAASTFKRGIPFINIPTTLLGAVDAAVGGKTGINFNSLKNEVGLFRQSELVVISTTFFRTLTSQELLAGYAEMIKHAVLTSKEMTDRLLGYDVTAYDPDSLLALLQESVAVKCSFVNRDMEDKGVRRALNFGHTVAHAFEALAFSGSLFSSEHNQKFRTERSEAKLEREPGEKHKFILTIDGVNVFQWFRDMARKLLEKMGIRTPRPKQGKSIG